MLGVVVMAAIRVPIAVFGFNVASHDPDIQVKLPSDAPFCATALKCEFTGDSVSGVPFPIPIN